jgi:hypothetical protein
VLHVELIFKGKLTTWLRLQLVEGAGTAPEIGRLKVVEVDPSVGRVLGAAHDRPSLVHGACVLALGRVAQRTRPEESTALAGSDGNVEGGESGLTALLHVREVEEEREDAGTCTTRGVDKQGLGAAMMGGRR